MEQTMADAHVKHHDSHLVDPSPWPAIGATSAFIMAVGAIGWMHHSFSAAPYLFGAGVIGVLYTMLSWWRDVINEAEHGGFHTRVVQISHRYGMILFIASEVMFFVAWFWAYFDVALFPGLLIKLPIVLPDGSLQPTNEIVGMVDRNTLTGGQWPPKPGEGFQHAFDPW